MQNNRITELLLQLCTELNGSDWTQLIQFDMQDKIVKLPPLIIWHKEDNIVGVRLNLWRETFQWM